MMSLLRADDVTCQSTWGILMEDQAAVRFSIFPLCEIEFSHTGNTAEIPIWCAGKIRIPRGTNT